MSPYRSPYTDPDPWDSMADNLPSPMGERMAALEAPDPCADVVTRAQWRAQQPCPDPAAHERLERADHALREALEMLDNCAARLDRRQIPRPTFYVRTVTLIQDVLGIPEEDR